MPVEGSFADGREVKSVSKRSADLLTISLLPPLLLLFHSIALSRAGVIKFSTPLSGIAVWISGEIKRFARRCTFAARRADAAADQRDAASRSRALQIVTTIPIQTPPTKASRVEGEKRGGGEELVNTLESRRLVRRILSRTVVSEPLLPLALVGFSTFSPLFSSR